MRDTRQQIIDLAYEKFLSVGFSKVSLDSLVEELHISKSTLYKYFPSKDDLLIEVIHKYTGGVDKMFLGFLEDPELEIMDKFVAFTEAYGNGLQQLSDAFIRDLQLFAPAIWASEVIARDRRFAALFGRLHDMAVEKGLFRVDIDRDFIVYLFIKMTEMVYSRPPQDWTTTRAAALRQISEIFLKGVLTPEGKAYMKDRTLF
jgi:AcrR family transcriptional regulator